MVGVTRLGDSFGVFGHGFPMFDIPYFCSGINSDFDAYEPLDDSRLLTVDSVLRPKTIHCMFYPCGRLIEYKAVFLIHVQVSQFVEGPYWGRRRLSQHRRHLYFSRCV